MIFLVNLELAYCMPPLGLNLFISGFRFNRPATSLYRPILPFLGVLLASLLIISYVPSISTLTIKGDIKAARDRAEKDGVAPTEAWKLECVQEDPNNPKACTDEEKKKWETPPPVPTGTVTAPPVTEDAGGGGADDELLKAMMGGGDGGAAAETGAGGTDEELLQQMMGGTKDAGAPPPQTDDDLLKQMMGAGKDGG